MGVLQVHTRVARPVVFLPKNLGFATVAALNSFCLGVTFLGGTPASPPGGWSAKKLKSLISFKNYSVL
jgi:hypothetical protein